VFGDLLLPVPGSGQHLSVRGATPCLASCWAVLLGLGLVAAAGWGRELGPGWGRMGAGVGLRGAGVGLRGAGVGLRGAGVGLWGAPCTFSTAARSFL